jgi:DNA polymerase-1
MTDVVEKTKKTLFIKTLGGRRLYYKYIKSPNFKTRGSAERQCFNALIQGGARDILHRLVIESAPIVSKYQGHILNLVHDECVVEVPDELAEKAKAELNTIWENRYDILPGLCINGSWNSGANWYEAK